MNSKINCICSLINKDSVIADVGCDHAYLSLELLKQNKIKFAYNIDINSGPLKQGKLNLINSNYYNKTQFILNNGLNNLNLEIDYIIIAGMGANNIIEIIKNSSSKTRYFILQPNNNIYKLRIFLKEQDYKILEEKIIFENNTYYEILLVSVFENTNIINDVDIFIGPINKNSNNEIFKNYIKNKINYFKKIINNNVSEKIKKEYFILKEWIN